MPADNFTASDFMDFGYADPYLANQTPYDIADNGTLSATGEKPPSWLDSFSRVLNTAGSIAGNVIPLVNPKTVGKASAGKTMVVSESGSFSFNSALLLLGLGLAGALAIWLVLRKW